MSRPSLRELDQELGAELSRCATDLGVPGAAVGLLHEGAEHYAFHGVTSLEEPRPVAMHTLFQIGSTTKTFTSTLLALLAAEGAVELDAPVLTYLPDLSLQSRDAAARVTVRQLTDHSAGWDGDFFEETGDGDDALAEYVTRMVQLEQISPPGTVASYNNAAVSLAGRVIEVVTGRGYERVVTERLLEPLGLTHSLWFPDDVMTHNFAVGHMPGDEGLKVARPWAIPRGSNPAGGLATTAADQIRWASFHLSDGHTIDGDQLATPDAIAAMREPTIDARGSGLADSIGMSWLLTDVGEVRFVGHGGTTNGQHSSFEMVPERDFAVTVLTNSGPHGPRLCRALTEWVTRRVLGIPSRRADRPTAELSGAAVHRYVGTYGTQAVTLTVRVKAPGLVVTAAPTEASLQGLNREDTPEPEEFPLRMVQDGDGLFVVTGGPAEGTEGTFRQSNGVVEGLMLGGRWTPRRVDKRVGSSLATGQRKDLT